MGSGELINHIFLHCVATLELWHKLFILASLVWVPPRCVSYMLTISFRGLGNTPRGKVIW